MSLPGHTTPQAPPVLISCELGAHAQGAAGHSATTTTSGGRRTKRRTNGGADARTTSVPDNIPAPFAPVASVVPVAFEPPRAPSVPSVPAGHRRTDGRAAWDGRSQSAAARQGASASNYAPRGPFIPTPTTTPPWSVAGNSGPSEPLNVLQRTYHPRPHYQVGTQGNTSNSTLTSNPSHYPGVRPGGVLPPSNHGPPAPSFNSAGGQLAYGSGSISAPSIQYLAGIPPSRDAVNQAHQTPVSFVPAFTPPLAVPSQTWEHYNAAMNSPLPLILLPCTCPPRLMNGAVPKTCSKAADHLLAWWHECNKDQSNQFRIAVANNYAPPNAIPQSYKRAASQDTADRGPTSPPRETGVPQERPDTREAHFSAPSTTSTLFRTTHSPFTSLPTHPTSPPTRAIHARAIHEPSDVAQHLDPFVSHPAPSGGDPYSAPIVQVVTINPSETVGPSRAPPRGGTLSNRRKASLNAVNPPAKRSRRAPQSNTTGNTEPQVVSTDESLGFESLDDQPEVQKAMRALVATIRASQSFINKEHEPDLGTLEADALMAVASDGLWRGYGTKAKSIYSLFIKVDGKEFKCLWCGDVQKDKLQRAVGHFRAKHLGHEPFLCGETHASNEICNVRFASYEAMGEHKRRKVKVKVNGKLQCDGCGRFYISVSNRNRHLEKCDGVQADSKHDDDEY